jgi:hypothetical protein
MEIHLHSYLVPGYRDGIYSLDITALHLEDGEVIATRDLLRDVVYAVAPTENTDVRLWAIAILRSALDRSEQELLRSFEKAPESLTVSSFKPKQT